MNTPETNQKLTPAQDAESAIPEEALKELRAEWARSAIGEMTYPQWCEQQTVFARRMVALIVNEVTNGMQGKGDDGSLVGLMQFAAGASLNWMPVLGAASATLGR